MCWVDSNLESAPLTPEKHPGGVSTWGTGVETAFAGSRVLLEGTAEP